MFCNMSYRVVVVAVVVCYCCFPTQSTESRLTLAPVPTIMVVYQKAATSKLKNSVSRNRLCCIYVYVYDSVHKMYGHVCTLEFTVLLVNPSSSSKI